MARPGNLLVAALAMACGPSSSVQQTDFKLVAPTTPIVMEAGETRTIQLLAIGTKDVVTYSGQLPAFVSLDGALLMIAPSRADAGDYILAITATSRAATATATVQLSVTRYNTAPTLYGGLMGGAAVGDNVQDIRMTPPCPGPSCTLYGAPRVRFGVCDAEGDDVTVEVEIVEHGNPFTQTATYSASGSVLQQQSAYCQFASSDPPCGCFELQLTGLASDRSYDFAVRLADEFGAVAAPQAAGNRATGSWYSPGWYQFTFGPCSTGTCPCVASGTDIPMNLCGADVDCCSGVCGLNSGAAWGYCK